MSFTNKIFGSENNKFIERAPRFEYFASSNLKLDDKIITVTVKNISISGLLIEFFNKDRDFVKNSLKKEGSYSIAIPYDGIQVREQVIAVRTDTFCGSIICGCRFDDENTDDEIREKRERFINTHFNTDGLHT